MLLKLIGNIMAAFTVPMSVLTITYIMIYISQILNG